jgi:hypothetical protein
MVQERSVGAKLTGERGVKLFHKLGNVVPFVADEDEGALGKSAHKATAGGLNLGLDVSIQAGFRVSTT